MFRSLYWSSNTESSIPQLQSRSLNTNLSKPLLQVPQYCKPPHKKTCQPPSMFHLIEPCMQHQNALIELLKRLKPRSQAEPACTWLTTLIPPLGDACGGLGLQQPGTLSSLQSLGLGAGHVVSRRTHEYLEVLMGDTRNRNESIEPELPKPYILTFEKPDHALIPTRTTLKPSP